jgi:hypothetical protein
MGEVDAMLRMFLIIKSTLIALLAGSFLSMVSSCATMPKESPPSGELKLIKINVPEAESIRVNSPYTVYIHFESEGEGKPDIKDVCFTWSGDGPHCFKVANLYPGSPSTIKVQVRASPPGSHQLECFALYNKDGKIKRTNDVSTRIRVFPK